MDQARWKGYTYHHLIYRIDYIVHLVPRNEAIVVHVIQTEGPWKETRKGRETQLTSATELLGRCPKGRFVQRGKTLRFVFYFSFSRACKYSPRRYLVCNRDNFGEAIHLIVHFCSDCDRSSIAILSKRTIQRVSFIVSHCGDHLS